MFQAITYGASNLISTKVYSLLVDTTKSQQVISNPDDPPGQILTNKDRTKLETIHLVLHKLRP